MHLNIFWADRIYIRNKACTRIQYGLDKKFIFKEPSYAKDTIDLKKYLWRNISLVVHNLYAKYSPQSIFKQINK